MSQHDSTAFDSLDDQEVQEMRTRSFTKVKCTLIILAPLCAILLIAIVIILSVWLSSGLETSSEPPLICVSGVRFLENDACWLADYDVSYYAFFKPVQEAGGVPITLPILQKYSYDLYRKQMRSCNGLIVQGGYDINSTFYGEENLTERSVSSKMWYTGALAH